MICYATPDKWTSRTVRHDPNGRALIILEAEEITTVRLDLTHILERGETIVTVQDDASGCESAITYVSPFVYLTVAHPSAAVGLSLNRQSGQRDYGNSATGHGMVLLNVMTSLDEQMTFRIGVRLPDRRAENSRVTAKAYSRGSIL